MTATELDDVTALLGRVLPDPTGFAERLVQQLVTRWAGGDLPAGLPRVVAGEAGDTPDVVSAGAAGDTLLLLTAALGACDCWGLTPQCPVCAGEGTSGWTEPDVELFRELVGPALVRISTDHQAPVPPGAAAGDTPNDQTDGDPA